MTPLEQRGSAILRRLPPNAHVAEVGVLVGGLSDYILMQRSDITLLMVDSWLPAHQQPERYRATGDVHANEPDAYLIASYRCRAEAVARSFGGRATIMAMPSVKAASRIANASLDLVFLDADHSCEGVTEDIAAWLPRIKPGGWIGGHDYANTDPSFRFGVDKAVDAWAMEAKRVVELDQNFTWFTRC